MSNQRTNNQEASEFTGLRVAASDGKILEDYGEAVSTDTQEGGGSDVRRRNFLRHGVPLLIAGVAALSTGVYVATRGGLRGEGAAPSLQTVLNGGDGLRSGTPTYSESQVEHWPDMEALTTTSKQAADGPSAIVGSIDHEVYDGGPRFSNDTTRGALEADIRKQALAMHGNAFLQAGETFSVPDIHPKMKNVVTGGNRNIPNS
jgi:hypothetical protein